MRAVHVSNSVAKTGLTQPVASGLPSSGTSTSDAFASLVQALADLQGQNDGSDTATDDGAGSQGTQTQAQVAAPITAANAKTDSKTASKGDSAIVAATIDVSTAAAGTNDKGPTAPTDSQAPTYAEATTGRDQIAMALLAGALVPAQVAQIAPQPTTPADTTDTTTVATIAAGQPAATAQPGAPATDPAATIAVDAAASTAPAPATPTTATTTAATTTTASAQTDHTQDVPPLSQDATDVAQIALAIPSGLAALQRLSIRSAPNGSTAAPAKTDQTTKSTAPTTAANVSKTVTPAALPATPAPVSSAVADQGLTRPSSDGLSPAHSHTHLDDTSNTSAPSTSTTTDTANAVVAPVVSDTAKGQPTIVTPQTAATAAAASPAVAAAAVQTASAAQSTASSAAADAQNIALLSRSAALAASAVAQVNVVLQRAGLSRADSLTVQLDPAELGRVEVKLKMDKNGGPVHATVTADRPQTLDMLKSDKTSLERALQSAGLSTDSGSLSFNLRGNGSSSQQTGAGNGKSTAVGASDDGSTSTVQLAAIAAPNGWTESGRLDLRV